MMRDRGPQGRFVERPNIAVRLSTASRLGRLRDTARSCSEDKSKPMIYTIRRSLTEEANETIHARSSAVSYVTLLYIVHSIEPARKVWTRDGSSKWTGSCYRGPRRCRTRRRGVEKG